MARIEFSQMILEVHRLLPGFTQITAELLTMLLKQKTRQSFHKHENVRSVVRVHEVSVKQAARPINKQIDFLQFFVFFRYAVKDISRKLRGK